MEDAIVIGDYGIWKGQLVVRLHFTCKFEVIQNDLMIFLSSIEKNSANENRKYLMLLGSLHIHKDTSKFLLSQSVLITLARAERKKMLLYAPRIQT